MGWQFLPSPHFLLAHLCIFCGFFLSQDYPN
uniref:Uncharacterized protein n=1 Tax=Anguilla anguilla TaxID=7936 RepID=A0A0E9VF47_ANGAN